MQHTPFVVWRLSLRRIADAFASWHWSTVFRHPAVAAAIIGLGLSLATYTAVSRYWDRPHLQQELDTLGESRRLLIQEYLTDFEQYIDTFSHHFQSLTGSPHHADLIHCADKLGQFFKSIAVIGWVPQVLREGRAAHEAHAALEGLVDYRISDRSANGNLTPAADRDTYFPLLHSCGEQGSLWTGLDLGGNAAVRQALDRARDTDAPAASDRVRLLNGADSPPVVVIAAPAYLARSAYHTVEERRRNLAGFAAGIVDPGKLLDSILRKVRFPQGLDIQFLDAGAGPNDPAFHVRSSLLRTVPAEIRTRGELEAGLHSTSRLEFSGKEWDMVVVTIPNAPLLASHNRAWIILIAGLMLTSGAVTYTWRVHRINMSLRIVEQSRIADLERFRVIFDSVSDAIFVSNPETGAFIDVNSAGCAMFGFARDALIGRTIVALSAGVAPYTQAEAMTLLSAPPAVPFEWYCKAHDGRLFWAEISLCGSSLEGRPVGLAILRDITERKAAEHQLQFANSLLASEIEASPDGVLAVEAEGPVASFNRRFLDMWSIPPDVAERRDADAVLETVMCQLKEPDVFRTQVRQFRDHPGDTLHGEIELKNGCIFEFHFAGMWSEPNQFVGRICFFRDITERKRAERQITEMAGSDALTGLPNRRAFVDALEQALARARRGEKGFAVLYLDLDHFKDINDTLGHPVGDLLLQAVARRLRASVREIDTVARFGGDEFAVIEADIGEPGDAAILADKLLKAISKPFSIQGNEIRSGTSAGITVYGPAAADAETLLSDADIALYRAKSEGRGTYRFFTDSMDAEVRARVRLGAELRMAIETGQLFLLYQPQIDIETRRIAGLEAMVRWNHPRRGVLGPEDFVAVAEQSGLIVALGGWIMREACRQTRAWLDAGLDPCVVAMSVSRLQFKTALELENDITAILTQTGLTPNRIELEVTESVLMEASREHNDVLVRLRQSGLRLAIDDFGTGYSSLGYLRQFPVDRIKIARLFVKDIADYAAIVRATISLALALDLNVIATGVESAEQLDLLKDWGCREAQGAYFAPPLPPEAIAERLRRGRVERQSTLAHQVEAAAE